MLDNSSLTTSTGWISDSAQFYINVWVFGIIIPALCLFGVVSNIINVIVFLKQGISDCITLTLLYLAVHDIGVVIMTASSFGVPFAMSMYFPNNTVDLLSFAYFLVWVKFIFVDISMATTLFLSLQKSLAVAWPFKFKNTFTLKRTGYALAGISTYAFSIAVPNMATVSLSWQFDESTNSTRLLLELTGSHERAEYVTHILHICITTFIETAVMICAFVLTWSLQKSSSFRKKTSAPSGMDSSASQKGLSDKELNVVKMVFTVAAVFILCNIPDLVFMYVNMFEPEFGVGGKFNNIYFTSAGLFLFCHALNSSVNMFIYLAYSPRYKPIFYQMFGIKAQ